MVINTDADVIRVIRQNPRLIFEALSDDKELLDEVRRLVMTEDVLALPGRFSEMQETQNEMLADIRQLIVTQNRMLAEMEESSRRHDRSEAVQNELLTKHDQMLETQNRMLETQNRMLETQNQMFGTQDQMLGTQDRMIETQNRMLDMIKDLSDTVGHLVGSDLERKLAIKLPTRLEGRFGGRNLETLVYQDRSRPVTPGFRAKLDDAVSNGIITQAQRARILDTDMIVQATRDDSETVYFAIEASSAINEDDIDRAMASAEVLRAMSEREAEPIVVGYSVHAVVRNYNRDPHGNQKAAIVTLDR